MAKLIQDDQNIYGRVFFKDDIDTYKVKWNESGVANFYLEPQFDSLNLDLFILDQEQNLIESSLQSTGLHELIKLEVSANRFYYIQVKHAGDIGPNTDRNRYLLRCKIYPQPKDTRLKYLDSKYSVQHINQKKYPKKRPAVPMNPEYVTIHSTANKKSTAQNERNWLTNPLNKRQASFHIAVDEKEAIECIPLNEVAWHAGDGHGNGNMKSIGIEICESGNRESTLDHAIVLTAQILKKHGLSISSLRCHHDWTKKNCPRILIDDSKRHLPYETWAWFKEEVLRYL